MCFCLIYCLDYVGELFQFFMTLSKQQLQDACIELKNMVPDPMNSMLEKQPREEAIRKRTERMRMVAKDVPPKAPGLFTVNFPGFTIPSRGEMSHQN